MKKVLLALMICSIMVVSGCNNQEEPKLPKSIQTYQKLNLTPEQNKKLADIRAEQRKKIDAIRNDIESKRKDLLDTEKNKTLSDEQKRANQEKYRTAANDMRVKLAAERVEYDNAMMSILDDSQKKIYQKYMDLREKEKEQRTKEFQKHMK
ncbi:MAG: Spy/CpxP family protein refolding chaperone [bacterium]|nr:Spy/CpxP family protein refolding chaperone [bacterium]